MANHTLIGVLCVIIIIVCIILNPHRCEAEVHVLTQSSEVGRCADGMYFDKVISETCQPCHQVCNNGKTKYDECKRFCSESDKIDTGVDYESDDEYDECDKLCTEKFDETFLVKMKCMDNKKCIIQLMNSSKDKCGEGYVLEPVLSICRLCDSACETKLNTDPIYSKDICVVACATLYSDSPNRPTTSTTPLSTSPLSTTPKPTTVEVLFIFAIIFFVVAVIIAVVVVGVCLCKYKSHGSFGCGMSSPSRKEGHLGKNLKDNFGFDGTGKQDKRKMSSASSTYSHNASGTANAIINIEANGKHIKDENKPLVQVTSHNQISSDTPENAGKLDTHCNARPPIKKKRHSSPVSGCNVHSINETDRARHKSSPAVVNNDRTNVSPKPLPKRDFATTIPLSVTRDCEDPLKFSIQDYSEEQYTYSFKSNIGEIDHYTNTEDVSPPYTALLNESQLNNINSANNCTPVGIHRPAGQTTIQDLDTLPQNLSLIHNVKEKFENIVNNGWVKRAICNGRYIRVLYDAIDEKNARNEIKRQTGLESSRFDVVYAP